MYIHFLENQEELVNELEFATRRNRDFEQVCHRQLFYKSGVNYVHLINYLVKKSQSFEYCYLKGCNISNDVQYSELCKMRTSKIHRT